MAGCHFPKRSIKRIRLMQFHTQVGSLWVLFTARGWVGGSVGGGGQRGGLRIFMLSNYQPLCPTTGLVNLFSTFSGVTKYISKALPLISGEYAAEEPSPHYRPSHPLPSYTAEERRETERVVTNCCCARRGEEQRVGTKLTIRVQFSVSAEVTELCHAGS